MFETLLGASGPEWANDMDKLRRVNGNNVLRLPPSCQVGWPDKSVGVAEECRVPGYTPVDYLIWVTRLA